MLIKKREQIHLLCMDEMVPKDHLLRIIDKAIDWTFIYDLVKDKYSHDTGRPSMDPVTLIKKYLSFSICMESRACVRQ